VTHSKKKSFIQSHRATILIGVMIMFMLFSVSFASATDWTAKSTWSEEDMKITFTNWWGLGGTQGSMELVSHDYVKQVKSIWAGKDRVVIYYDLEFYCSWEC